MPKTHLPVNPSLENLRKRAKALCKAARAGEPEALARVREMHPRAAEALAVPAEFSLAAAQLVIAREYGFVSWAKLAQHLEVVDRFTWDPPPPAADESVVDRFLRHACLDYIDWNPGKLDQARRLFAQHPEIAGANLYAAAAVGDVLAARQLLDADPTLVHRKGGPLGWEPLLYLAYSRFESPVPGHTSVETARLLLARGADPNAGFLWRGNVPPFTALTGVFGEGEDGNNQPPHPERDALVRVLLDAGADPNDDQTLYNCQFGPGANHLRLLLAYGLGKDKGGPWIARLERLDRPAKIVADELVSAAKLGRLERVQLLVEHGVDVDAPGGRDREPAHEVAVRNGNRAIADYLVAHGARPTQLPRDEAFAAACAAGDRAATDALLAAEPGLLAALDGHRRAELLAGAVAARRPEAVRLMAALGFDLDVVARITALHDAAWSGDLAMVKLLIELGANPQVREPAYDATPLGWAAHNRQAEVVAYLVEFADLFAAIECGGVERVRALLAEDPARARRPDAGGKPPIFHLDPGSSRAPELLELLLAHGADLDARDPAGQTLLDQLVASGDEVFAELVRRHQAKPAGALSGAGSQTNSR